MCLQDGDCVEIFELLVAANYCINWSLADEKNGFGLWLDEGIADGDNG